MDDRYFLLRDLYEGSPDPERISALLEDDELRAEYEEFCTAKHALDACDKRRPDPAVIDAVVAAARMPTRLRLVRRRPVYWLSAAASVAVLVVVGVFRAGEPEEPAMVVLEDTVQAEPEAAAKEAEPAWDESEHLVDVYGRLAIVRARSSEVLWDESAVMSLDSLPADPTGVLRNLELAGTRQQR